MKRFGKLFNAAVKASAFMVAAVIAFASCEEPKADPSVTVNQSEVTADAAGTSVDVTVNSNVAWTAEAADKWVTVSPAEGIAGETKVTVTVKKNNSEDARETSVTFSGEGAVATVAVKQFGKDVVTIDKKTYAATPAGGSDAVKVTSNTDWTAASSADWVTVTPAEGAAGETAATVTVAPNATADAREAKVTFTAGEAKAEYTVSQEAVSVAVSQSTVNVAGEGAEATVTVTANAAWTATASADWVTVDPIEGEAGSVEVTVTAEANDTEADRTATVTFAVNEDVTAVVTVSQAFVKPTGKVTITVPTVTSTTATVVCTPDPLTGFTYYYTYAEKEGLDLLFDNDSDILDYVVVSLEEALMEEELTWGDIIVEGEDEYQFTKLTPAKSYYVLAFGIDATGDVTTGLFKQEFTTNDVNPALKNWIGTWQLTSTDTYESMKGGVAGLTGKPSERVITISNESVFGVALGEEDLVVSGLSYTDAYPLYGYEDENGEVVVTPMETVGTVNAQGQLELKNECEIADYGDDWGMITWFGNAYIQGKKYYISGGYSPYTLALNSDKASATGTPATLNTSAGECTIAYYDVMFISDAGASSVYTLEGYGALSGTWTLTKVVQDTTVSSLSVNIKSRIQDSIKANAKKANFMREFNSKGIMAL